ncbi:MAG: hypothetical protein N2423_04470, partial [Novosphingobium sp.]|nr:hypothetical protein [Novosphingobium sp.]
MGIAPAPREKVVYHPTVKWQRQGRQHLRHAHGEADLLGMSIGDVFEEEGDEQAGAFMGLWLEALIRTGALSKIEARF